jgi:uncharacterized DUF497 family protein
MRFRFSKAKSDAVKNNPKRGIDFDEVQQVFTRSYYQDQRSDDPEQYRAIGWAAGYSRSSSKSAREETQLYEANA